MNQNKLFTENETHLKFCGHISLNSKERWKHATFQVVTKSESMGIELSLLNVLLCIDISALK